MTALTRVYRFSASHRLHAPGLSDTENQRLYGKCNNPFGHGHDYVLEVTAAGAIDPATGLILPRANLDRLVEEKILTVFANRNINLDVREFASLVPTTENIALVMAQIIEQSWSTYFGDISSARLRRVHLQETARNGFEVLLPAARHPPTPHHEMEHVHA
jgi:6-pyruvoyltetrahydropterin/6-carboxytetrahydropterin synthase